MWADAMREAEDPAMVREVLYDEIERAPKSQRKAFGKVATAQSLPVSRAVVQYLNDRAEGNGFGYKPLGPTSVNELHTAINHLCAFTGTTKDTLFLNDLSTEMVLEFRGSYLPSQKSKKTGKGLTLATVEKSTTMLRGLWRWALAHKKVDLDVNPFDTPEGVPRAKKTKEAKTDQYKPEETQKILEVVPQGDRLGDLFRLGLVTGARITEIAKVTVDDTYEDGSVFFIEGGKTDNAKRVVPVPVVAQPIVKRLRQAAVDGGHQRLFHAFPLAPKTNTAKAASKAFTNLRRKVLGVETDGRLNFHSTRHTWKTTSRRAGLSIDDAHDLGGWATQAKSSDPYDHGLNLEELTAAQSKVTALLDKDGHLEGF
ncbi:tyrosine-type recombinase/integrase [Shimia sp. Alg240-R146]|uniref:tyrosine-type recombinase/integrase n=1 Tax=Shimia sp. Alg240-R146 TaxID=2993449 RepID=UPI0022DFA404|nr:tyrosine-type recombinase/integrase [Shimia sp. Alg240-R146]